VSPRTRTTRVPLAVVADDVTDGVTNGTAAAPPAASPTAATAPATPAPVPSTETERLVAAEQAARPRSTVRTVFVSVGLGILVVALILLAVFFDSIRHWVALHTGIIHGGPDQYYNFWSGFGSDLGEVTLITAVSIGVYTGVRKVNCHTKGCWRIGHHPLDGTPYILCRRHHPGVPTHGASHQHILEQHRRFLAAKAATHQESHAGVHGEPHDAAPVPVSPVEPGTH